ncbi:MAG: macro domain-containing protein [Planctomycetes bacterium]|nr:macro domain-containing protein [Planctomycetota bacterium]
MIQYTAGNLLDSRAEAVVNTVNEVGVMGKGIALMIHDAFPANAKAYQAACRRGDVQVGRMLVFENAPGSAPRWIVNFPTKKHWRHSSKLEWIEAGLQDLVRVVRDRGIRSIALPPLGCGNGGLEWSQVKSAIDAALEPLDDVKIEVFQPTDAYLNAPKRNGVESLTPARALIVELVRRYAVLGLDCTNLEIHKLAWFLSRAIALESLPDPLKLSFEPNKYGPYADALRHVLDALDGSYLHCEKRLADAGPLEPIWFEPSRRSTLEEYLQGDATKPLLPALDRTATLVDGFESPLGLELLSTVDWLLHEKGCEPTVDAVRSALRRWPGGQSAARRKSALFSDRLLTLALGRLQAAMPTAAR